MGNSKPTPWAGVLLGPVGAYLCYVSMRSQLPGSVLVGMFGVSWSLWHSIRSGAYAYQFARDKSTGGQYASLAADLRRLASAQRQQLVYLDGTELKVRVSLVDGVFDGDICVVVERRVHHYNTHTYHNDEYVIEEMYLIYGIQRKVEVTQRTRKRVIGISGKIEDAPLHLADPPRLESKRLSRRDQKAFNALAQAELLRHLQRIAKNLESPTGLET